MKTFGYILGSLGAIALLIGISFGLWEFNVHTAHFFGQGNAEIQIQQPSNQIADYDHFFNLCVSVQDQEGALDSQYDLLVSDTNPADQRWIQTNIAADRTQRLNAINQYNIDATKHWTIGQFRASNLPYQLSTATYDQKGPHTQCSAN